MRGVAEVKSFKLFLVLAVAAMLSAQAVPSSAQEVFENLRKTFNNLSKPPAEKKPVATAEARPKLFDSIKRAFADVGAYQAVPGGLPAKYKRTTVAYPTKEVPGTIIIDSSEHYLYLVLGGGQAMRYGIGVGREGFGWRGTVRIGRKAEWPGWTPPPEMVARERQKGIILPAYMDGGIKNPLGARALYLYNGSGDTAYRIHGSNEPWTIGHDVSSGCFRMVNKDVIDLYKRAQVGAKVIVR
jgi:lipoprotein-anchoring transpeptidase ErfK/SrfK